jgi:hypothetical protein
MVAVAAAGLALGACQMLSRRTAYLSRAAEHAGLELGSRETGQVCRENVVGLAGRGFGCLLLGDWTRAKGYLTNSTAFAPEAVRLNRLVGYHARLRAKYERAARQPWLPVAPDPPPPD